MEKKMMIPSEALTKGLPIEFSNFLNYVKTLRFEEKPDYQYLKNELREMFCEEGFLEDWEYDWCCLSESPKEIENSLIKIRITNRGQESVEPGSNK